MNESSLAVNMVSQVLILLGIAVVLGIITMVCIASFSKGERKAPNRNFSEAFDGLLRKYDLVDKADLKKEFNVDNVWRRFTLLRKIAQEEERHIPLPRDFIEEVRALVYEFFDDLDRARGNEFVFQVKAQGMTLEEIYDDQEKWNYHVRMCLSDD